MKSISETGYAKIVANLGEIISTAEGIGTTYDPFEPRIKVPALKAVHVSATNAINAVRAIFPAYTTAVGERELAFLPLNRLVTRITSSLKACGASAPVCESAMTLARKIKGTRTAQKLTEEEKKIVAEQGVEIARSSSSQMSYDSRLDNLNGLIKLLKGTDKYAPNEADLKTENLEAMYEDLKAKNNAVIATNTPLSLARVSRNEILYKPETGLVDAALLAKAYIKSIYGTTNPVYKRISGLTFNNKNVV